MFRKKPVLKYESLNVVYPDIIKPSKKIVPEWFKNEKTVKPPYTNFKQCLPFLDSLTSGYLIVLPVDLLVLQTENGPHINWKQSNQGVNMVGFKFHESIDNIPTPHGYHKDSFFWKLPVCFEVPVGYSLLFTQPLNRFDLPFQNISVVIDGGYTLTPYANVTFFLREGFEGIIPQGTPIAQIIPYKNDNWKAEKTEGIVKKGEMSRAHSESVYSGWYKKTWWVRKNYS